MAAAIVQSAGNAATGATVAATFGTAPTAGSTVLAFINSDNVFTVAPTGGTRRYTFLDDQQFDIWEFTGSLPTTVTVTPGASDFVAITLLELSGTSGFDLVGAGTKTTGVLTTATSATITTTAANDLVLACTAMHGDTGGAIPASPSWGNGFTVARSTPPPSLNAAGCGQWVGQKTQATASAVGATTVTWTGPADNQDSVMLAYSAAAAGTNFTQSPTDDTGASDQASRVIDPSGLVYRELTVNIG